MSRARWIAVVVVVVVGGLMTWGARWLSANDSDVHAALVSVPVDTQRLHFTDWRSVRAAAKAPTDPVRDMSAWLHRAYSEDLTPASLIAGSGPVYAKHLGFSPANVAWEAYALTPQTHIEVLKIEDAANFGAIASHLKAVGYLSPSKPDGIWTGGSDPLAAIDPQIPADFANVALLGEQRLVIASRSPTDLADAVRVAQGDKPSLASVSVVVSMSENLAAPAAAVLWTTDFVCGDLAMSHADESSAQQAKQAISAAGGVTPMVGFALAWATDGVLTVAAQEPSDGAARHDVKSRALLATGPAFGRGETSFSDDFAMLSAKTRDATVQLRLKPKRDGVFPLSSLYSGPLVFASC